MYRILAFVLAAALISCAPTPPPLPPVGPWFPLNDHPNWADGKTAPTQTPASGSAQ